MCEKLLIYQYPGTCFDECVLELCVCVVLSIVQVLDNAGCLCNMPMKMVMCVYINK